MSFVPAQQPLLPGGTGGGAGIAGVTSITETSTVAGAITFTGAGVSQSGTTFNFPGATLGSNGFDAYMEGVTGITNYYPMNETSGTTVTDAVGSSNGTYTNAPTLSQFEITGDAEYVPFFNNSYGIQAPQGSYASIPDTTTSGTTPFSIMCAAHISAGIPSNNSGFCLFSSRSGSSNGMVVTVPQPTTQWAVAMNGQTFGSSTTGASNQRTLLILTYTGAVSGTGFNVYINGQLVGQMAVPGDGYSKGGNNVFTVGYDAIGGFYWNGLIGKFAIADATCWNQSTITGIYRAFCKPGS